MDNESQELDGLKFELTSHPDVTPKISAGDSIRIEAKVIRVEGKLVIGVVKLANVWPPVNLSPEENAKFDFRRLFLHKDAQSPKSDK